LNLVLIDTPKSSPIMQKWLEEGYKQFAHCGPEQLSIKKMGEALSLSRASFYHHFGDTDVFINQLLEHHWNIVLEFNQYGKNHCKQLYPDVYRLLAKYPIPLQFSMQLFHNRKTPAFNYLFMKHYESTAKSFILKLFADEFSLKMPETELYNLWLTCGEAWYSRLNSEDLSAETLLKHSKEITNTVFKFAQSPLYQSIRSK